MNTPSYTELIKLLQNGLTVEAREKLVQLGEAAVKLQEENLELKERLKQYETKMDVSTKLLFDRGLYWLLEQAQDGSARQGPFCQVCYDTGRKLVRLHPNNTIGGGWFCAACGRHF